MKIKKEYIVLVAIIVALSTYLIVHKRDKTHYQLPELADIDAQSLTRIPSRLSITPRVVPQFVVPIMATSPTSRFTGPASSPLSAPV